MGYDKPRWGDPVDLIRVELPLLEALVLHGRVEEKILASIETPGLKRMQFQQNSYGWHSLVARNLGLLVQRVEYLYVWLSDYDDDTSFRIEQLGKLVDEAPSLIGVFVGPWMGCFSMREYKWTDTTRNLRFSPILDRYCTAIQRIFYMSYRSHAGA